MKKVDTDRGSFAMEEKGEGRPLLLAHGFPLDHTMWRHQLNGLCDRYRVIAPDLRGFGRSDVSITATSMADFADDLAALLDALRIDEPIAFCGLSMGGYVGLEFHRRHPDRVARMIFCDTKATADTEEAARQRMQTAEHVLINGTETLAQGMVPKLFAAHTREHQPKDVEAVSQLILKADPVGVASALRGMAARDDFSDRLEEINCLTLVVCGVEDAITPLDEMRAMADGLPRSTFVEIPRAGHMAPLEQASPVNAAIRQALW